MALPIVHVCVFVCMSIHFKSFVAGLKTYIVDIDLSIKTVPIMHLKETKHNDGWPWTNSKVTEVKVIPGEINNLRQNVSICTPWIHLN